MALLSDVIQRGTLAARPAATAVATGTLYFCSDSGNFRSNGTSWESIDGAGGSDFISRHLNAWGACFTSGTPTDYTVGTTITPTETGTQTAVLASTNLILNYASGAVSGNDAGIRSSQLLLCQPILNPDFQAVIRSPSTMTNVRIWAGLISAVNTNSDTLAGHGACFRYSTVVGDAGWLPITRDGATQNPGTAIGTVVADTLYRLRMRTLDAGVTWKFSVNGSAEQDVVANVPGTTTSLGFDVRVYTQTAGSRNIGMSRIQLQYGAAV